MVLNRVFEDSDPSDDSITFIEAGIRDLLNDGWSEDEVKALLSVMIDDLIETGFYHKRLLLVKPISEN